jgi:type IX secretion system PorP/SprF family membrane protein
MKKLYIAFCFVLMALAETRAQDPQFTQFYAAPLYLNPAFAGSSHLPRVVANYRNQWSGLPASFSTYSASYDHWFKNYNSGAGVILLHDKAGATNLKSTSVAGTYSYELKISDRIKLRSGLEFGLTQRTLDYSRFVFGDQLLDDQGNIGTTLNPSSQEQLDGAQGRASYLDVGTGFLLYSKTLFLGVVGKHLNQPNQSMVDGSAPLPIKYAIHGGAKLPLGGGGRGRRGRTRSRQLEMEKTITPAFMYRTQGKYDQLDLGAYVHYNPMILGVWYRGMSLLKKEGLKMNNQDAIAVLIGFQQDNFTFGYSYDVTVSQLGFSTAGSHELSMSVEIPTNNNRKRKGSRRDHVIPCPKF